MPDVTALRVKRLKQPSDHCFKLVFYIYVCGIKQTEAQKKNNKSSRTARVKAKENKSVRLIIKLEGKQTLRQVKNLPKFN